MIVTVTLNPALDRTLWVPHIQFDNVLRATYTQLDWGGKGFNVSRALAAVGANSVVMGLVGGATGQLLEQGLNDLGLDTDLVSISGETRTNTVIAEEKTGRHIKVNEQGPVVLAEELVALNDRVRNRVRPGDLWVLSGSLPPGTSNSFYAQLATLLQAKGAKVLLDTSGEPLRHGLMAAPFLVKPNADEASEMVGWAIVSNADALGAVRSFREKGVAMVALSLGAEGLLLASGQQRLRARPPHVEARSAVGAGDALLAGIAWALEQDLALDKVVRWGVAMGTAAAARGGVGVGSWPEVEVIYGQTTVDSL